MIDILSYLVSVGVIALPFSILTAGYIDVMESEQGIEAKKISYAISIEKRSF